MGRLNFLFGDLFLFLFLFVLLSGIFPQLLTLLLFLTHPVPFNQELT